MQVHGCWNFAVRAVYIPLFSCRCGVFDTERSFATFFRQTLFCGRGLYDWMARSGNFELLRVFAEDQSSLSNLLVI